MFITKKHPDIVHDLRVVLVGSLHEPLNCERLVLLSPTTGLVEQSNVVLGLHFALQGLLRIPLRSLRLVLWYSQHPARKDSSQVTLNMNMLVTKTTPAMTYVLEVGILLTREFLGLLLDKEGLLGDERMSSHRTMFFLIVAWG